MLKHLTVIELASVLAGPAVGMFLAELGAKVIKIENPDGGDVTRQWKLPSENAQSEVSAYFSSVNYGKEYLSLDLKTTAGKKAVIDLIATADIVLTNFKAGDGVKLGLDYETLKALNPNLIYGCITGFGPNDSRTAFDVVLQAEAGLMYMNGTPESEPIKWPVAVIDLMAAHQLKEGILLALLQRERTGLGAKVSVSLYDAAIASLANQATNWLMAGHIPQRLGSLHPNIAPYGETLTCADSGQIVLAVGNNVQYNNLCSVLNLSSLPADEKYNTNSKRVTNRESLLAELQQAAAAWKRDELLAALLAAQVPAGAIRNMQEVFAQPNAQKLINNETIAGVATQRPATAIFTITH
jgi:crotonobetainyl-CoA:carnitine CoA-transferase CaiB-like acyl-CoA transferase